MTPPPEWSRLQLEYLAFAATMAGGALILLRVATVLPKLTSQHRDAQGTIQAVVDAFSGRLRSLASRVDGLTAAVSNVSSGVDTLSAKVDQVSASVHTLDESVQAVVGRHTDLSKEVAEITSALTETSDQQQRTEKALRALEERYRGMLPEGEHGHRTAGPSVAATLSLTPTERDALREISREPMTAPQLRQALGRSREHTARLLRKLYDEGYLERDSRTIPFRYSISSAAEEVLKGG